MVCARNSDSQTPLKKLNPTPGTDFRLESLCNIFFDAPCSCPNIWSLLLIFGFLYWSSSWWWQSWQSVGDFYPLKRAFSHNPWAQLEFYEDCGILWCCVEPQGSTGNSIFGLQTPKGGCHPMLYFKYQTTEKYCYARLSWHILVYDCGYVLVHGSSIDPIGFKI